MNVLRNILINPFFTEIIVSTWKPQDEMERHLLRTIRKIKMVKVIINEIDSEKFQACPDALQKQVWTTLNGMLEMRSPFVVKVRSDEWFDLHDFIEAFESNAELILFSNFLVRPWSYHSFHISDHLFAGDKAVLEHAFWLLSRTTQKWLDRELGIHSLIPESCIGFMIFREQQLKCGVSNKTIRTPGNFDWETFRSGFELYDLQRICGQFEVHARRAQVGPVTNLRELGSLFRKDGLPLDFVYYPKLEALKPQGRAWTAIKKRYRYARRKYLAHGPLPAFCSTEK